MIRQFVPEEFCLKCQGCCRFSQINSVWSPCLLDEEIQALLDKEGIPPVSVSIDRRIQPVPILGKEGFVCPLLDISDNKCKIYHLHPFECQIYPFLINVRKDKVLLTVDLNCPYAASKIDSQEAKDYILYLASFLNSPKQLRMLKDNPQLIQAYEEVREVAELNLPHEIK